VAFLHPVRITFAGRFQADVSTVNNDVRHYDDAAFVPGWQTLQESREQLNGWWNPTGSGAFRLVGCTVTEARIGSSPPPGATSPADPVLSAIVTGADDNTAAKLVDIDPQWQLASAPWGLTVRLIRQNGRELLRGSYRNNPFRDLWFSRNVSADADGAASSTFQSVLEDVVYDESALSDSPVLSALRAASEEGRLSIRLTTLGYDGTASSPTFTLGTMIGTIGPYLDAEPESYVCGRRFAPASGFSSYGAAITYFSGLVHDHPDGSSLLLDLSNALTVSDGAGTPVDIGELFVGVLAQEAITENTPVGTAQFHSLAGVPYRDQVWLQRTGGVVEIPLDDTAYEAVSSRPLALVNTAGYNPGASGERGELGVVAIRETSGGLFVGAEPGVLRLDTSGPSHADPARAEVRLTARRYGRPLEGVSVHIRQLGRVDQQGGGNVPGTPDVASVPIPPIGIPEEALVLQPAQVKISAGRGRFEVQATDPGNPRGYIDGQLYLIDARLPGQPNTSRQPFDVVVVHVRDAYDVPAEPTWKDHVAPILTQYGNLYPIMSHGFIDLSDEAAVRANRDLLLLAFTAPMTDPNHMPVTRDLSEAKRQTLVRWLQAQQPATTPAARRADARAASAGSTPAPRPPSSHSVPVDSKKRFADGFLNPVRATRTES